ARATGASPGRIEARLEVRDPRAVAEAVEHCDDLVPRLQVVQAQPAPLPGPPGKLTVEFLKVRLDERSGEAAAAPAGLVQADQGAPGAPELLGCGGAAEVDRRTLPLQLPGVAS